MRGRVLALDGHDGAGKSTLAALLAGAVGARCVRPYAGERGAALMQAYEDGDTDSVLQVGLAAVLDAVASAGHGEPLVLDRAWLTVSTLVPQEVFAARWAGPWVPTVLVACDLQTTLGRLGARVSESMASGAWHARFIGLYEARSHLAKVETIRTDRLDIESCLERLIERFRALP
jgi:energy-coupling factor transporter ATP-binding protein EcfA2